MSRFLYLKLILFLLPAVLIIGDELRTWRAVGGYETRASFVSYEAGTVTLRKEGGEEISLPLGRLHPADRIDVIQLSNQKTIGKMPTGPIEKPTGRREVTWHELEGTPPWPESLREGELDALQSVGRTWKHAESRYFILHYQSLGFARQVARMADYQYQFIASDLPDFRDRFEKKSHIFILRNGEEWRLFLSRSSSFPEWAAAFVRGDTMFLYDIDDNEANAAILAHEMSHLVLNRFFRIQPPLWLNEGLAEWYGNSGYKSFKGQKVDPEDGMGRVDTPFLLEQLFQMPGYPKDPVDIQRFYTTSKQVVGMLMLSQDQPTFVQFLELITVQGHSAMDSLAEVYNFASTQQVQAAFQRFLRQ